MGLPCEVFLCFVVIVRVRVRYSVRERAEL